MALQTAEAGTGPADAERGSPGEKPVEALHRVVIRIAGDSGDGMQLTGDRFTQETAAYGNDLSTLPDFPAEIRAPAGTLPGVSAFQLHFADHDILTPGDAPDVLVAMNPAALKTNLKAVPRGGTVIVNTDEFTSRALKKVGYDEDPLQDGTLDNYRVHRVALTSQTVKALDGHPLSRKEAERAKNRTKSKVRAKVEHAIGVIKRVFGFVKVRYRGLAKNAHRLFVACALANLYMARRQLISRQAA